MSEASQNKDLVETGREREALPGLKGSLESLMRFSSHLQAFADAHGIKTDHPTDVYLHEEWESPAKKIAHDWEQLSTDKVRMSFSSHENVEGSYYVTDVKTGMTLRFRLDGLNWYDRRRSIGIHLKKNIEARSDDDLLFMPIPRDDFDPGRDRFLVTMLGGSVDDRSIASGDIRISLFDKEQAQREGDNVRALMALQDKRDELRGLKGAFRGKTKNALDVQIKDASTKEGATGGYSPKIYKKETVSREKAAELFTGLTTLMDEASMAMERIDPTSSPSLGEKDKEPK